MTFVQEKTRNTLRLIFGLIISLLFTACAAAPSETGTLEGHVIIDPLAPVVREGKAEPTPVPEVYAAREIVIFAKDGQTLKPNYSKMPEQT